MVFLLKFNDEIQANLIKGLLLENGIESELIINNSFYAESIFSVDLHINERDKEKAEEILSNEEYHYIIPEYQCRRCKSQNTYEILNSKKYIFFSIFLLFAPLILKKRKFYCDDCNKEWNLPLTGTKILSAIALIITSLFIWGQIIETVQNQYKQYNQSKENIDTRSSNDFLQDLKTKKDIKLKKHVEY